MYYLDPESVGDCFAFELQEIKPHNEELENFASYLVDTYIDENALFPPKIWASKSSCTARTTNCCESFHAHLNKCFNYSHPNIFVFLTILKDYQSEIYVQIQSVEKTKTLRAKTKRREWFLEQKIKQLDNNEIGLLQYVKLTSHYYNSNF